MTRSDAQQVRGKPLCKTLTQLFDAPAREKTARNLTRKN